MGTISVSLPSDGETMDASDVNNPINTIVALVNGNIDSNNITAGGLTPANLTSGTGSSWAWQSWTPTLTNLTLGNGTMTGKYVQIGKVVHFRLVIVLGSTSSVSSSPTFTLPVTAAAYGATTGELPIGQAEFLDSGVASYLGAITFSSTTVGQWVKYTITGSNLTKSGVSATSPFTFGTGDELSAVGVYEAA